MNRKTDDRRKSFIFKNPSSQTGRGIIGILFCLISLLLIIGISTQSGNACPPPLIITLSGPTHLSVEGDYTWNVYVTSGTPSYSYKWYFNSTLQSSTSSYVDLEGIFEDDTTVEVEVTDSTGRKAWKSIFVTVGAGGGGGGEGEEPGDG